MERQVRGAGRLQRLDAVLDLGVLAVQDLQRGDVSSSWSVMKHWKRCPSRSVKVSCARGAGARAGRSAVCPSGQASRLTWPVSSVTHAHRAARRRVDRGLPRGFSEREDRLAHRRW